MCRILKYLLYLLSGGLVLTAGFALYIAFFQPPFYFPQPTGSHAVGTVTYHWVDDKHKDTSGKELMVQIWYPAEGNVVDVPTTPYAPYFIDYCKKHVASGTMQQKLESFLSISRPVYSYAVQDATLANGSERLPVIIFSHGLGCTRNHSTAHCEELASHGYVVVGISHTYACGVVQFPDGRIAVMDSAEQAKQFVQNPMSLFKKFNDKIEVWIDDVQMVLDRLEQVTADQWSPFYGRFDMNNVGIFGHSYGGAAATQLCRRDHRIKAGVNMDGGLYGSDATKRFEKPFMFLFATFMSEMEMMEEGKKSGLTTENAQEYARAMYKCSYPDVDQLAQSIGHDVYKITLQNAGHMAFSDIALMKEACFLPWLCQDFGAGSLNGYRATEIISALLVAFFDKYLKGKPSGLLDGGVKKYNECLFECCNLMGSKMQCCFITGTSGSGKSTLTKLLQDKLSKDLFIVHDFDEKGVPPDADALWRQTTTKYWLAQAIQNAQQSKSTVICGVTVPTEVVEAAKNLDLLLGFGFMKISDNVIEERLKKRGWSEHLIQDNINWAHHLERDVVSQVNHRIVDCSSNTPEQIADEFVTWILGK